MTFRALPVCVLAALLALRPMPLQAQQWLEMRSAHFVVTSNAGQSATRTLTWQLEQIRSAISTLFGWAQVDLDRPVAVFAVRDERSMRALAPQYWELKGGVRPASVWVSAPDQHYFAIRADVQVDTNSTVNPHITAYHAYVSLIQRHSSDRELPLWFSTGFAGVLSNTIVRDTHILFGPPIPWHLDRLRERGRLRLDALMKVTPSSAEYTNEESRYRFDAQSWALVHFLMFSDQGSRRAKLNQFIKLISSGTDVDVASREAFGQYGALEADFVNYISRNIFSYLRVEVDAAVNRESFPTRPLSASESAAASALFHVAMNRPAESRAAIAEARKTTAVPDSFLAEAMLLDREGKRDEASAAFERAVDGGSTSGYAHYRLAILRWDPQSDRDTLAGIEKLLLKATALNNRHAASYALLGEVRSRLGSGEALPLVRRAIALDPSEPSYHLTAVRILLRQQKFDEALKEAQVALGMAETDGARQEAQRLITSIEGAKSGAALRPTKPAESSQPQKSAESPATDAPVRIGPGIVPPRLLEEAKPAYTSEAMRMRVEGVISLEAVVLPDGATGPITVTKCELKSRLQDSTNKDDAELREALLRSKFKPGACTETFGLDVAAVNAAKQWRFAPGTREGIAVRVLVSIEMSFKLR